MALIYCTITLVSAFAGNFLVITERSGNLCFLTTSVHCSRKVSAQEYFIRHLVLEDYTVVVSQREDMDICDKKNFTVATALWCVTVGDISYTCHI